MACVGSVGWSDARKGILHLHKLVQKIMESEGTTNPGADPCPFPYFSNACMRVEEPGFIEEFLKLIPNLLGLPKVDLWYMDPYVERQFGHQLDHSLSSTCFWWVIPIVAY